MDIYLWLKAFHIMAVIAWMAGLFYLPRLFVYHTMHAPGSATSEQFEVMEGKLLRIIMNPAMIAVIGSGAWLIVEVDALTDGWMHVKLVLVAGLVWIHMLMARWRRAFAEDRNEHSERFYRFANEIPTLLMVGIVIMAVVKPW